MKGDELKRTAQGLRPHLSIPPSSLLIRYLRLAALFLIVSIASASPLSDWPMFRGDSALTGVTDQSFPNRSSCAGVPRPRNPLNLASIVPIFVMSAPWIPLSLHPSSTGK
jgi:hypothetical protein